MPEIIRNFLHHLLDVRGLIEWGGVAMVCMIVFAETGLFVGFFLPGDSLLVTVTAGGVSSPSTGPVVPQVSAN